MCFWLGLISFANDQACTHKATTQREADAISVTSVLQITAHGASHHIISHLAQM
jgi:hypothetical protein